MQTKYNLNCNDRPSYTAYSSPNHEASIASRASPRRRPTHPTTSANSSFGGVAITNYMCFTIIPKLAVVTLRFRQSASASILNAGGEVLTADLLALKLLAGAGTS